MIEHIIENTLAAMEGRFSVVLKELTTDRQLFSRDADKVLPSASTIKILIMIEAYNQAALGELDLYEKIRVKKEDMVAYSIISHMNTEEFVLKDIITLMMSISDNTATNVLIDRLGMERINHTAEALGLQATRLRRKMMDFGAAKAGRQNTTSAAEMQQLMEKLYRHEVLTKEACIEMLGIMSIGDIERDYMVRKLPEDVIVAHKPGELDGINHDIGILYLGSGDYLLGIFAAGLPDNVYGRECIARLAKDIYDELVRI